MPGLWDSDLTEIPLPEVQGWWAELPQRSSPGGATLTITGGTPGLATGKGVAPSPLTLTLASGVPAVAITQNRFITPTSAALTVIGSHPALGLTLRPDGRVLTVIGGVPVVTASDKKTVIPMGASLTATGSTPSLSVTQDKYLSPTAAPLTISGGVPAVTASDRKVVIPVSVTVAITGSAPSVTVGVNVNPAPAALALTTFTPSVSTPRRVAPTGATLTVVGSRPALGLTLRPSEASVTVTGGAPAVRASDNRTYVPSAAALTITRGTPIVTATNNKVTTPAGANVALTASTPTVSVTNNELATPTGLPITITGGTPTISIVMTLLTIKGTPTVSATSSVTIPTHAVGDIIVMFAFNSANNTPPTKPTAAGTVPAWVDIDAGTGVIVGSRSMYFVATATNHTSGTWTYAGGMCAVVLTNQNASPIGGHAVADTVYTTSIIAPAVTMSNTSGSSVLLHFHAVRSTATWSAAPTGYTRQVTQSVSPGIILTTKDSTTSDGSVTNTVAASSFGRGATIEILK